ncbi:hypothetical protein GGX14DRAFT_57856 [Mycena pura]|uniref:Uncharacterized protein n=1 Tax=Mycena pura TaxID=153505 RepID=A0AAD6VLM8_9AGAR|nr:hypothetical protein GGX14DRAFT_57856 [Mycena pura]
MRGILSSIVLALGCAVSSAVVPDRTLTKDVIILGGGASGTYAAVRLREDYNKSIVVIESRTVLGGNVNTYNDPVTGTAINYGVEAYIDYGPAKDFFARFDVPTQPVVQFATNTTYVDAATGTLLSNITVPPVADQLAALQTYLTVVEQYTPYLLPGYWDFPPGDAIPADMLLPWADFEAKYGVQDMYPIHDLIDGGGAPNATTLYVMMDFNQPVVAGYLDGTMFDPRPFNNSILYGRAQEFLGADVHFSSQVVHTSRTDAGVSVLVRDDAGTTTLITAPRLLASFQPTAANLAALAADAAETDVFSTFATAALFVGVVRTNFIPENTSVSFVPATDAPPYSVVVDWSGTSGLSEIIFVSAAQPLYTEAQAKQAVVDAFTTLLTAGTFAPPAGAEASIEIVAFAEHAGVGFDQSVEMLEQGFIQQMYALQGRRSTWWTGALWCPGYSSNVWAFTDTVLPKLLEGLH